MIVTRNMLICMIGICMATSGILIYLLCTQNIRQISALPELQEADTAAPAPAEKKNTAEQYAAIVNKKLFSPSRVEKGTAKPDEKKEDLPAAVQTPGLTMLGGYPNEWPRLKLTGVFFYGSRLGAIISGGDALPSSSGEKYDSMYYEGDTIGGGVKLGPVSRDSVILYKDLKGWSISIGQDPPAVQKK